MKKINILKENKDFNRIIKQNNSFHNKLFLIHLEKNTNSVYHFGFSVGKKIGNAVIRNKLKRQIKNILDKKQYQNNFNCIIMVKKSILTSSFEEMEIELLSLLGRLDIFRKD